MFSQHVVPPRWIAAAMLAVTLVACTEPTRPSVSPSIPRATPSEPDAAVLDGRSPDGIAGFYWSTPFGPSNGTYPGTFDAALAPSIEVCWWESKQCQAVVARLTTLASPDGRIVVDATRQLYIASWIIKPADRDPAKTFRLRVLLDGRVIGYGDLAGGNRADMVVRFRLETGLRVAGTVGPAGGVVATPDGTARLTFPAGALTQPTPISVSRTTTPTDKYFLGTWTFGPSPMTFAAPVQLSLAVDPALLAAAGPGAMPYIVTRKNPTDTAWTVAGGFNYDANTGRVTASITHFSTYGVIVIVPSDVNCSRILGPQTSGTFFRLNCAPPAFGQYRDTIFVSVGGSAQSAYLSDIGSIYRAGQLWILGGVIVACENLLAPYAPWPYCAPALLTTSSAPSIATRGPTGLVTGHAVGQAELIASVGSLERGRTLVIVGAGPTVSRLFSFANGLNADLGTGVGTAVGGASRSGGRLALNGSSGYVELNQRLVGTSGSFTVALFAREAVTQPGWMEFVSQGQSGSGFYVGRDPSGIIRVSDAWLSTGVAMPSDNLEHHYAVTFNDTTSLVSLYVDGQLTATRSGPLAHGVAGGSNTRFGRQFDPFGEYLNGTLDDVSVLGAVLSAKEVKAIASRSSDYACSAAGTLFSGAGAATAMVFENQTGETVKVEWLDFLGNRVLYHGALATGTAYTQGTYLTHPWIITGVNSGTCYGIWMPVQQGRVVRIQ